VKIPNKSRTWPLLEPLGMSFCCILEKVEQKTGLKFSNAEVVAVYQQAMHIGIVQKEVFDHEGHPIDGCDILNGVAVFNLAAKLKSSPIRSNDIAMNRKNTSSSFKKKKFLS